MLSDLFWQIFKEDGSVYSYIKYVITLRQEGVYNNDSGQVHCRCVSDNRTADR